MQPRIHFSFLLLLQNLVAGSSSATCPQGPPSPFQQGCSPFMKILTSTEFFDYVIFALFLKLHGKLGRANLFSTSSWKQKQILTYHFPFKDHHHSCKVFSLRFVVWSWISKLKSIYGRKHFCLVWKIYSNIWEQLEKLHFIWHS